MGATFSRLKIWGRERLRYSQLNAEFDNILQNLTPSGVDDFSVDVTQMRLVSDPAPYTAGTQNVVLPTSLSEELRTIRFMFSRMSDQQYWYLDTGRVFSALPEDVLSYFPFDGASGAVDQDEVYSDTISRGGIINALGLDTADLVQGDFDATNKKFGRLSLSTGPSKLLAFKGKLIKEGSLSCHFRQIDPNDYIAYNPLLGLEVYLDASGFLTTSVTKKTTLTETTKEVATVAGTTDRSTSNTFQHVAIQTQLSNALGANTDSLAQQRDGLTEGAAISASNIKINAGDGGIFFLGARKNDPVFTKLSMMKVTPDVEAVNPWSATNAGQGTITTDGNLQVVTAGLDTVYENAFDIDLAAFNVDVKFRILSSTTLQSLGVAAFLNIEDTGMSRFVTVQAHSNGLIVLNGGKTFYIPCAMREFNVIRLTSFGSPDPVTCIYVNGLKVLEFINDTANVVGADKIQFGVNGTVFDNAVDVEYIRYVGSIAAAFPPIEINSGSGQLDDVLVTKNVLSAGMITALMNNPAKLVFGNPKPSGMYLPLGASAFDSPKTLDPFKLFIASDGKTPVNVSANLQSDNPMISSPSLAYDEIYSMDDGYGTAVTAAQTNQQYSLNAKMVLPLGLRSVNVMIPNAVNVLGKLIVSKDGN